VDRRETVLAGLGYEARPAVPLGVQVLGDDRLSGPVAVEAGAFLVLELEQLKGAGPLAGGRHQLEVAARVGEQQAGFDGVEHFGGPRGEHVEELDHIEVVHEGVGQFDEGLNQPFLPGGGHRLILPVLTPTHTGAMVDMAGAGGPGDQVCSSKRSRRATTSSPTSPMRRPVA
jgi:hypothetical protein